VSALGVALALVLASVIAYFAVRNELRGQVDDSLKAQAARIVGGDLNALGDGDMPAPSPKAGGPAQYSQIVASSGTIVADLGGLHLPIDTTARAVAGGRLSSAFEDIHVEDSHLRMLALGVGLTRLFALTYLAPPQSAVPGLARGPLAGGRRSAVRANDLEITSCSRYGAGIYVRVGRSPSATARRSASPARPRKVLAGELPQRLGSLVLHRPQP
jgi:hypothetical protein